MSESAAETTRSYADAGSVPHAVQILMDFEGLAGGGQDLFKAALAVRRHLLADPT